MLACSPQSLTPLILPISPLHSSRRINGLARSNKRMKSRPPAKTFVRWKNFDSLPDQVGDGGGAKRHVCNFFAI
jgi:hypothetical protein